MRLNKKSRNIIGITQSVLIFVLVVLVVIMMIQIDRLQGTARVINYAGLVRGATQREVKLEIAGSENDELIEYLDDILSGLKYQDGHYDLLEKRAHAQVRRGEIPRHQSAAYAKQDEERYLPEFERKIGRAHV